MKDLSILIPSRSEPYLQQTIEDIKAHAETDPEILWEEDIEPIGQRALCNRLASKAIGQYLLKIDAHCSFTQGFDRIMLEDIEDDLLAIDLRELDVDTWKMNPKPLASQIVFNSNFDLISAPERPELVPETMAILGVGFMVSKENYFKYNLIDASFGSWGLMGLEVPLKMWLAGKKVKVTKKAQMGHWYKQGEKVPYPRSIEETQITFNKVKDWAREQDYMPVVERFDWPADWLGKKKMV